jgi:hypothetical protein
MAGTKRPSFLKRQKEQQRLARAVEKRETKAARKQAKADGTLEPEPEFEVLKGPRELDEYGEPI